MMYSIRKANAARIAYAITDKQTDTQKSCQDQMREYGMDLITVEGLFETFGPWNK